MDKVQKKWDRLSAGERKQVIDSLIGWYKAERGEEIGYLAAEAILDQVMDLISDHIYQKGISDANKIVEQYVENMKVDLDVLQYESK